MSDAMTEFSGEMPTLQLPTEEQILRMETTQEDEESSRLTRLSSITADSSIVERVETTNCDDKELLELESKMGEIERRNYIISLYENKRKRVFNIETLNTISSIVRNNVVKKVKFIDNEQTSGMSKEAKEETKNFPSFWKPDLSLTRSLQNDIFHEFPELSSGTLDTKVRAWMGMRDKVRKAIQGHRNAVHTAIQTDIVEGKLCLFK